MKTDKNRQHENARKRREPTKNDKAKTAKTTIEKALTRSAFFFHVRDKLIP